MRQNSGTRRAPTGRRVVVLAPNATSYRSLAAELVRQWRDAGLDAVVSLMSPSGFPHAIETNDADWNLILLGGGNGPDPDVLRARFASDGVFRFSGFSNPRFEAVVRAGGRNFDLPGRAVAYREAQQILVDELPILPIAEAARVTVRSRRVYGLPQAEARGLVADHDYSLVRLAP